MRREQILLIVAMLISSGVGFSELRPNEVHQVDLRKNQVYLRSGLFVGGDRSIDQVTVKDIRRAVNPGFERIVVDLEGTQKGEPAAIPRASYFQVAVSPEEKKIVFTLWGTPHLGFDAKKVLSSFKSSAVVQRVMLYPALEEQSWTFALDLKASRSVEIFELAHPVRIIVDVKTKDQDRNLNRN